MIQGLVQGALHAALLASGVESRRVATSEGEAHVYRARGAGRGAVTLLHGFASSATAYAALVRALRPSFGEIVAPELLGHGRSETPPGLLDEARLRAGLRETLDVAHPPGGLLVGTSLGGAAAIRYALERPRRVGALVLVSPAGAPLAPPELDALRRKFDVRTRADARRFLSELLHAPPWYAPALEPMLVEMLGRDAVRAFLASVEPSHLLRAEEVASLGMPVLLVWGRSDRLLPRGSLAFFRGALPPGATIEEPEGLGHSPHLERPAWVAARIARFARDVEGSPPRGEAPA